MFTPGPGYRLTSCQEAWNVGGADSLGKSILGKSALAIAGYKTYARIKYHRSWSPSYSTILKENDTLYYLSGSGEAKEHSPITPSGVYDVEIIFEPLLGGYIPMIIYEVNN